MEREGGKVGDREREGEREGREGERAMKNQSVCPMLNVCLSFNHVSKLCDECAYNLESPLSLNRINFIHGAQLCGQSCCMRCNMPP